VVPLKTVLWLIWATPVMGSLGWIESPVPNQVLAILGAHGPLVAREPGWWLRGPAAAGEGAQAPAGGRRL